MDKKTLAEYKEILEDFLREYEKYITRQYREQNARRSVLQQDIELVSRIVSIVHRGLSLNLTDLGVMNFYTAITYSLTDSLPKKRLDFVESNILCTINEAIGNITNNTLPVRRTKPILEIKDEELKKRCLDILDAPGNFDRVIREATVILEDRLRSMISREQLANLIPLYGDQTLEKLINVLLSPQNPVIYISSEKKERVAFHRMMLGICSYLRNPFHHSLDRRTEWSLAWSVTGLIDSLLYTLSQSKIVDNSEK